MNDLMKIAHSLIEEYFFNAFAEEIILSPDAVKIDLAYTELEEGNIAIQVEVDLKKFTLTQKINNKVHQINQYSSLKQLIEDELMFLDFDALVRIDSEED